MTARKAITERMKIMCLLSREVHRCYLCSDILFPNDEIDWDHIHALVHEGDHAFTNLAPVHRICHKAKTARDVKANAKVKRILNPRKSKHPMKSGATNWPKRSMGNPRLKRGFDGKVTDR